jgi:hypothetical protein
MRTEINSRVPDGRSDDPVEPAAPPIKERAIDSNYRVIRHVPRRKRWSRSVAIGLIGKTDGRSFEQGHEFRVRPLHFDHAHTFYLLGPTPIDGRLQHTCEQFRNQQRQEQAHNERSTPKTAKKERAQPDRNEQRLPNVAVAQRGHEQVERRVRPSFVDEMQERLVHAMEVKRRLSFNRYLLIDKCGE